MRDGSYQLRVKNLETGVERVLLDEVSDFSVSPDGRYVGYVHYDSLEQWIAILDRSTSKEMQVSEKLPVGEMDQFFEIFEWTEDSKSFCFEEEDGIKARYGIATGGKTDWKSEAPKVSCFHREFGSVKMGFVKHKHR